MFKNEQYPQSWDWDDLKTVLAVADGGSLSAAARLLGSSHPTVFRSIRQIEQRLDIQLFEKSATGYLPTASGEIVIEAARKIATDVDSLNQQLGQGVPSIAGALRLTCSDTVYSYLLAPMLAGFRKRYPDTDFEVLVSNEIVNLSRQDFDVAIRSARRAEQSLHGIKLADTELAAYAHKDHPVFADANAILGRHDWVGYGENLVTTGLARYLRDNDLEKAVIFRANSLVVACEAIRNNIGIGLMPSYVAAAMPDVRRIDTDIPPLRSELWAVSTRAQQKKPLVRAFFSFLGEQFQPVATRLSAAQ